MYIYVDSVQMFIYFYRTNTPQNYIHTPFTKYRDAKTVP